MPNAMAHYSIRSANEYKIKLNTKYYRSYSLICTKHPYKNNTQNKQFVFLQRSIFNHFQNLQWHLHSHLSLSRKINNEIDRKHLNA